MINVLMQPDTELQPSSDAPTFCLICRHFGLRRINFWEMLFGLRKWKNLHLQEQYFVMRQITRLDSKRFRQALYIWKSGNLFNYKALRPCWGV